MEATVTYNQTEDEAVPFTGEKREEWLEYQMEQARARILAVSVVLADEEQILSDLNWLINNPGFNQIGLSVIPEEYRKSDIEATGMHARKRPWN